MENITFEDIATAVVVVVIVALLFRAAIKDRF